MLSGMRIFARKLCALLVALALLAAPCLSMLGLSTGQASHVHHLAAVYKAFGASQNLTHHEQDAGAAAHMHHAAHEGGAHAPSPPGEQITSCCLLCEGCISAYAKAQTDLNQGYQHITWTQDNTGFDGHPAIADSLARAPPKERSSAGTVYTSSRHSRIPLYVLTQRYLI